MLSQRVPPPQVTPLSTPLIYTLYLLAYPLIPPSHSLSPLSYPLASFFAPSPTPVHPHFSGNRRTDGILSFYSAVRDVLSEVLFKYRLRDARRDLRQCAMAESNGYLHGLRQVTPLDSDANI